MHSTTLDWNSRLPADRTAATPCGITREKTVLLLHIILLFVLAGASVMHTAMQMDDEALVYPMCIVLSVSFVWILGTWFALRATLFEPYALFMLAAGLFNGGQAFLEIFGLNKGGMLDGRVPAEVLVSGLYLVTVSLMTTHLGALIALGRRRSQSSEADLGLPARQRATRIAGWILLGIAAVPAFMLLQDSVSIVLDYGYVWLYRRDYSVAVAFALSGLLVPGIIFLLSGSPHSRVVQGFCLFVAGTYAAVNLFLGTRGAVTMALVSIGWIFDRAARRIPRLLIAAVALVSLVVFALVRDVREVAGRGRPSFDQQVEALSGLEDPITSLVGEMGHSLVTVTHTLTLVPAARPFDLGVSYLYAALSIVPNLGWEVHPSIAHGLLSQWVTSTADPVLAAAGGGLGYSFIAEAYLNFGWFGGPLCLGFLGYLLTRLFLLGDSQDPAKPALVASFLSSFLIFSRGESAIVARGLVWYALVPYLIVAVLTIRSQRKQRSFAGHL